MKRVVRFTLFALLLVFGSTMVAHATPIGVSYTVSGSAGNYLLDFTLTNSMPVNQNAYLLTVNVPTTLQPSAGGSETLRAPTGWFGGASFWVGANYWGVPSGLYTGSWEANAMNGGNPTSLPPGESLSGFVLPVTGVPQTIQWLVYACEQQGATSSDDYHGSDNLNPGRPDNPFFGGVAAPAAVPLPSALLLFSPGPAGLAAIRRKLKK